MGVRRSACEPLGRHWPFLRSFRFREVLFDVRTGQKALYGLPIGRSSDHIFVWRSLLERAGFTLDDIPNEWEAFWSFWCDEVQPAIRQAMGRDDIDKRFV